MPRKCFSTSYRPRIIEEELAILNVYGHWELHNMTKLTHHFKNLCQAKNYSLNYVLYEQETLLSVQCAGLKSYKKITFHTR